MNIDNPHVYFNHTLTWSNFKEKVFEVVNTFKDDYSIITDNDDEVILLVRSTNPADQSIGRDQLLHIRPSSEWTAQLFITNESGKIQSFTELERDKKSLSTFESWLRRAIEGTLHDEIQKAKPKVDTAQAILQLIILIVALVAIFYGAKAFMMNR